MYVSVFKFLHIPSVPIKVTLHHTWKTMYEYFCLYRLKKGQSVTWPVQMQLLTSARRTFQTRCQKNHIRLTTVLRRIKHFTNLGNVENRRGRERSQFPNRRWKESIPTPATIQYASWGEQMQIWGLAASPYRASWKLEFKYFYKMS